MSARETGRLFAVTLSAREMELVTASRACALPMSYRLPGAMDGRLVALVSPEDTVRAIAIAELGCPALDGAGYWWRLNEIIVIPPVPCRAGKLCLFTLDSTVARLVVESAMEAAGLTVPVETARARGAA